MAIPWLIGGVAVAIVATVAAVISDDDGPSGSSDGNADEDRRRQERVRKSREVEVRKEQLQAYASRLANNLAKKYGGQEPEALRVKLDKLFVIPRLGKKISGGSDLLYSVVELNRLKGEANKLKKSLDDLENAMLLLEGLSDEFK